MDINVTIFPDKKLRVHKVKGLICVQELGEKLAEFYNSPEYDPLMNSLWDMTNADFSSVTQTEIRDFKEIVIKYWGHNAKTKAALLVLGDLDFGLSRMYEMLMSVDTSSNIKVFREYNDAERWLEEK